MFVILASNTETRILTSQKDASVSAVSRILTTGSSRDCVVQCYTYMHECTSVGYSSASQTCLFHDLDITDALASLDNFPGFIFYYEHSLVEGLHDLALLD